MSETTNCPKCGTQLATDAPAGLCPKCLVAAGFESEELSGAASESTTSVRNSSAFEPPPVEQLGSLFPQLEFQELIGRGGMGAVYKALQKELDRLVAVKILPPEVGQNPAFAERFTREARAMARLSHPNIVAIHDFGQIEGLFYFVMEYIDGANLRQTMKAGGMQPEQALAIVPQICDALQYAHDEGVVHRDIKPENILLNKKGRLKIADFGLSKLLGREGTDFSLTGTQQVMGTPRYMAPEQMTATRAVDHRADIYSLGVVFYELLTDELPIGRFDPPSKKVQVDVRLDEVVLKTLDGEPERRYQQANDVKTDVGKIASSTRFERSTGNRAVTSNDIVDRNWWGWPFVVLLTLVVVRAAMRASQLELSSIVWSALVATFVMYLVVDVIRYRRAPRGLAALFLLTGAVASGVLALIVSTDRIVDWVSRETGVTPGKDDVNTLTIAGFILLGALLVAMRFLYAKCREPDPAGLDENDNTRVDAVAWRGRPLTEVRFIVSEADDIPSQAVFHFSSLGYELIERRPDVCVFQRGRRWAGLWSMDMRDLQTRLTVRTARANEGQVWVSCDWSVRTLGSWIFRRDIERLEAEGRELEAMLVGEETQDGKQPTRSKALPAMSKARPPLAERLDAAPRQRLLVASIVLLIVGGIVAMKGLSELPALADNGWAEESMYSLARIVVGAVILVAAVLMMSGRNYPFAMTGSALAVAAGFLMPFSLYSIVVGFGVGLWCVLTLRNEQVRAAFEAEPDGAPVTVEPDAQSRLQGPATGLFITGLLQIGVGVPMLVSGIWMLASPEGEKDVGALLTSLGFVGIAVGPIVIHGARKMKRLERRRAAILASVLAILPISHASLVGIPVGIWSLAMLRQTRHDEDLIA